MSDLPSECESESLGRGLHRRSIPISHKPPHLQLSTRADKAGMAEMRLCSGNTEGSLLVNADQRTSHHQREQCSRQRWGKIRISTCHRSGDSGQGFAARIASLHPLPRLRPWIEKKILTREVVGDGGGGSSRPAIRSFSRHSAPEPFGVPDGFKEHAYRCFGTSIWCV
jgi:hypothetical protein